MRKAKQVKSTKKRTRLNVDLVLAILLLSLIAALAIYGFFISPYGVNELTPEGKLQPPSALHPCGTDHLGRDILTRLGQAGVYSLAIAAGIVALGAFLGYVIGAAAGFFGGFVDWILSRLTDSLLAFPGILMALLIITVLGRGLPSLILSLGLAFVPSFARIVRSAFQGLRTENFVKRLEIMDAPSWRIILVHLTPLVAPDYLNAMVLGLANAILAESSLSFLGFGIQAPRPSWGSMLADSRAYLFRAPYYPLFPGLALVLTVLAFFLLRRGLDRRQQQKLISSKQPKEPLAAEAELAGAELELPEQLKEMSKHD